MQPFIEFFKKFRKAFVAAATTAIVVYLHARGIEVDNAIIAVVLDAAFVAVSVWFARNRVPSNG